jgi:hypothetical protein
MHSFEKGTVDCDTLQKQNAACKTQLLRKQRKNRRGRSHSKGRADFCDGGWQDAIQPDSIVIAVPEGGKNVEDAQVILTHLIGVLHISSHGLQMSGYDSSLS